MKACSKQSMVIRGVFGCVLMMLSSFIGAQSATLFDDCLTQLRNDPHHIFSAEDVRGLQGDPRFHTFLKTYDRYTLTKDPFAADSVCPVYEKDASSAEIGNAFLRWTALNGGNLDVKSMENQGLEDAIKHINYLEYTFYPQVLTRGAFSPDWDTQKFVQLSILRNDIQLELESRSSVLVQGMASSVAGAPKPALWTLGGQYDAISFVSWDPTNRYVLCLGTVGTERKILVYSFDAATFTLSLCAATTIRLEGFPVFNATHLLWGPDVGVIIVGGNSPDRRQSVTYSYIFNSAKKTIAPLRKIQQMSGEEVAAKEAFWYADKQRLCIVRAGECVIFSWDKPSMSFTLEHVVYPGLNRVRSASLSYDMNYFLTEHGDAPFLRLTKAGSPMGVYSYAQFVDRLADPQWSPNSFYFVARSQIESDLIILYEYSPRFDQVYERQRVRVGAGIASMKWSPDGGYLFVAGEASMVYGCGMRVFAFDGKQLQLCNSLDELALGTTSITEAAYVPSQGVLLLAGQANKYASGVVCSLAPNVPLRNVETAPRLQNYTIGSPVDPLSRLDSTKVYQYLDEVPSEQAVVFGSIVMLANAQDPSKLLAVCDAPAVRCAHNGKAFPCARSARQGDFSSEYLSSWWIIEGPEWVERLDSGLSPFTQMSLRNLATGDRLCLTSEHAPINTTASGPLFVGLTSQETYLNVGQLDGSYSAWRLGERVLLKGKEGCVGVSEVPPKHPILLQMGISRLAVVPIGYSESAANQWVVSRNIPLSTLFAQQDRGSECCDFMLRRIDRLWGDDLKLVVTKALEAGRARGAV